MDSNGFTPPPHLIGSSGLSGPKTYPAVNEEDEFFERTMAEFDQIFDSKAFEEPYQLNAGCVRRVSIHQEDVTDEIIRLFSSS